MRAGPGLAPRVPARCSPAPSLADAGSEPLLHPPAARKDLPRVRPPEGGAPRVRAPAPRPGGLARCSPQRRQGASCDLRGRGAGAGVRPGVGPGTQAIPAPAPAAPPGRERAPSRGLRARAARWERRPSRNRRGGGWGWRGRQGSSGLPRTRLCGSQRLLPARCAHLRGQGEGLLWEAPLFLDAALRGSQAGRFLRQPEDEPPSPPGSSAFLPGCRRGRAHGSGRAAPLVPAPAPAPAREVGWLRATPAEVGLSLGLAGFFPPHLLPPHPAYTHSQSQGEDMPTGRGPRGDQRCPRSPSS